MAEAKLQVLITAKDEASKALTGIQGKIQSMSKGMMVAGAGMVAAGAGITAILGLAAKAAAEEEAGVIKLTVAMGNMGLSYKAVQGSLEEWIDTQQQKTAVADTEQRIALSQLIRMTGNLEEAQEKMTLAMDVAAGTGKDLASANQLVMYAMGGNWGMVERYIPALKAVQDEEKKWALLRKMFAGQAEAYGQSMSGQMKLLEANIGDIKEAIGSLVLDAIAPLQEILRDLLPDIKKWISEHEEVVRTAVMIAAALAAVLVPMGTLLILLPMVAAGFAMITAAAPWLLLAGGIAAAVAGMVALGLAMHNARVWAVELGDYSQQVMNDMREDAQLMYSYQTDLARDAADKQMQSLDDQLEHARTVHDERLALLDEEYAARIKMLDEETSAEIQALKDQLDAIDDQTKEENKILREQRDAERIAELEALIGAESNIKERARLAEQLEDLLAEIRRRNLLESRREEKQALRDRMDEIRTAADEERDRLAEELEEKKQHIKDLLIATTKRITDERELLNKALTEELTRINEAKVAAQSAEKAKLIATMERLAAEYEETVKAHDKLIKEEERYRRELAEAAAGETGYEGGGGRTIEPGGDHGMPGWQRGGIIPWTGAYRMHKGETVLPANTLITIPIYIGDELLMEKIVKLVGEEAILQGY